MNSLRILSLCPQPLWPINTGARLRNFHLANALASEFQVTVLQLTGFGENPEAPGESKLQEVLSAGRGRSYTPGNILRGIIGPLPVTVLNYTSAGAKEALQVALEKTPFDLVQLESIHLFEYLKTIRESSPRTKVVLDWHNIESELIQRYAAGNGHPLKKLVAHRTAALISHLERQAFSAFDAHLVVSEREKHKLRERQCHQPIHVIENGVDAAAFASSPLPDSKARKLLYVGSMDYHANSDAVMWFCREVWPHLAGRFPELIFQIVGRNPPPSVRALASDRILVTGTVPDVRPFYRSAFAVIVPLRVGGGTRLKILEAMAAGVPVISTQLGAEGLAARNNEEILIADTPLEMAACLSALTTDGALPLKLRQKALDLIKDRYDWPVLGEKLAAIYQTVLSS